MLNLRLPLVWKIVHLGKAYHCFNLECKNNAIDNTCLWLPRVKKIYDEVIHLRFHCVLQLVVPTATQTTLCLLPWKIAHKLQTMGRINQFEKLFLRWWEQWHAKWFMCEWNADIFLAICSAPYSLTTHNACATQRLMLTHWCLRVTLEIVVCFFDAFDSNMENKNDFTKYLMEGFWKCSHKHFFSRKNRT